MRFGINSLLFTETFDERDLPLLERCREFGLDVHAASDDGLRRSSCTVAPNRSAPSIDDRGAQQ